MAQALQPAGLQAMPPIQQVQVQVPVRTQLQECLGSGAPKV